jgi:serine phosphatase RsbU (regulator of sigma subunit)
MHGEQPLSAFERAIDAVLVEAHFVPQYGIPPIVSRHAAQFGADDAVLFLADLQQVMLVPFVDGLAGPEGGDTEPLAVDGTLAGRCFQHVEILTQNLSEDRVRVWLPLLDGTDRLGVLSVSIDAARASELAGGLFGLRLRRFASLVAELLVTKASYGDRIVRLRRRDGMTLAAELQWSLLPPLTFTCEAATVSGALEPAYEVAGDTLDYAVDAGVTRAAVFDGMGHGLGSSLLAAVAVAAYRNLRRAGAELVPTVTGIHDAMIEAFDGRQFTTALVAELDTDTGLLSWVSAGHPPPLLLREGRFVHELVAPPWPPLGLALPSDVPRREVSVGREQLEPGDRVLLYTDGVLEARAPDGEFFGEQRLIDLMTSNFSAGLPVPETLRRVIRALLAHQAGKLTDDATMLLLEWRTDSSAFQF